MRPPEDEAAWDRQAAQVRTEVPAWRAAHPTATLKQIEQEVDRQLAAARARLVEAMARARLVEAMARARLVEAMARAGSVAVVPPPCPDCGGAMRWEGERTRRLTTTHDQAIELSRRYSRCPACGTGLFPLG